MAIDLIQLAIKDVNDLKAFRTDKVDMGVCIAIITQSMVADVTDWADFARADQKVERVVDGSQ